MSDQQQKFSRYGLATEFVGEAQEDRNAIACVTSIVAKCPGMTGTVPEFLHLSRSCPG